MKSNIAAEFEMIQRTGFWAAYIDKLRQKVDRNRDSAVSDRDASLERIQGIHFGLIQALCIPEEIIRNEQHKAANTPDNLVKGPGKAV